MASWEDGPEYAPRHRPAAFVTPTAAPLSVAIAVPRTGESTPPQPPAFAVPEADQPILTELIPAAPTSRDPKAPFEVATAALNAWSTDAGGTADRDPSKPFAGPGPSLSGYFPVVPSVQPNAVLNPPPFAPPGSADQIGTAPLGPASQWATPVRIETGPSAVVESVTIGVIIPLALGVLFAPLSTLMLALAFFLSARIKAPQPRIRSAFLGALFVTAVAGMLALPTYQPSWIDVWDSLNYGSRWACFLLLPGLYAIVSHALRAESNSGRRP